MKYFRLLYAIIAIFGTGVLVAQEGLTSIETVNVDRQASAAYIDLALEMWEQGNLSSMHTLMNRAERYGDFFSDIHYFRTLLAEADGAEREDGLKYDELVDFIAIAQEIENLERAFVIDRWRSAARPDALFRLALLYEAMEQDDQLRRFRNENEIEFALLARPFDVPARTLLPPSFAVGDEDLQAAGGIGGSFFAQTTTPLDRAVMAQLIEDRIRPDGTLRADYDNDGLFERQFTWDGDRLIRLESAFTRPGAQQIEFSLEAENDDTTIPLPAHTAILFADGAQISIEYAAYPAVSRIGRIAPNGEIIYYALENVELPLFIPPSTPTLPAYTATTPTDAAGKEAASSSGTNGADQTEAMVDIVLTEWIDGNDIAAQLTEWTHEWLTARSTYIRYFHADLPAIPFREQYISNSVVRYETFDSNHDGAVDYWIEYRDGLRAVGAHDIDFDTYIDLHGYYRDSVLEYQELDLDDDLFPDLRYRYRNE